ncbi:hypothetical protein KY285_000899 [Solanum tuberosum]|nr:hypothetical protein KY285_000899 [Solanum tuberosum]
MQICSLVQQKPKGVKEYVAVLKLYQHPILANQEERFITLQMPEDFPRKWISLGFTHIDFGAIRVALTYYGRKGQPIVARISLLDTSFYEYQHENLGTSEITLNAGTVFVTLFPNFNMSLQDPVYNHAIDLSLPGGQDALFLNVTNYEKLRDHPQPIQSTEPTFSKKSDNTVAICFDHYHLKKVHKTAFSILMYQPIDSLDQKDNLDSESIAEFFGNDLHWIRQFNHDGLGLFCYKCPFTGHNRWDIDCDCSECEDDYKGLKDWPALSTPSKNKTSQKEPAPKIMFMLSSASSCHTYDFPDYQTFEKDNLIHAPKIPQKKVILLMEEHMPVSDIEATLNWKSENAMCQNRALTSIGQSIRGVAHSQGKLHDKISLMEKKMTKRQLNISD